MTDIVDKPITAGQLPVELRGDIDPASLVLLTVRAVTANGFTVAEEDAILAAEAEAGNWPFRPARDVLAEITAAIDEA